MCAGALRICGLCSPDAIQIAVLPGSPPGSPEFGLVCHDVVVSSAKEYLGDAVYADFDGLHIVLTTENGIETTNTIYLLPETSEALQRYIQRAAEARRAVKP